MDNETYRYERLQDTAKIHAECWRDFIFSTLFKHMWNGELDRWW